ncbi:glycoside hydrolase family 88/105 protein [Spirosoma utsteinense]|uniref:Rhamnogalacturonyl hydrolase YesR n=1 Tax=Spirosoma utsteinense TaxID=2585773 RepID=A0ABR6W4A3_9BACT|nr:glycoside hydrolase family 88 protein [Spirosoma utsteinense]MBC3787057.1 rhamnogalacturonyl hydrolase YesR [Spirosoma utsteinense]MBC3791394.1 rhamnogalacturonyl hydrolase YesR [Spirosoma utsteinense]
MTYTTTAFSLLLFCTVAARQSAVGQAVPPRANDSTTPLHLLKPDYPVPYGQPDVSAVTAVLNRVHSYLNEVTPMQVVDRATGQPITDFTTFRPEAIIKPGDYRLTSYEWGVTYTGMLRASEATGDPRFAEYTNQRLTFLNGLIPYFQPQVTAEPKANTPLRQMLAPHALDDAGAMCAAMIQASRAGGVKTNLRPQIDRYINYITKKEHRLADGTLARNRPQPNTLWLDDLFMAVPALAQMGKLTGDAAYYDEAVKQVLQFSKRMFNPQKGLYMHGWVEGMKDHPEFHWARANGWAIMTNVELLEVLPASHPGRAAVLDLLRAHVRGLAACQSGSGFWHQLLDRNDSYLETSATAIYTFSIARAINRGWIDGLAYAPMTLLAWNAVSTKVTDNGQVEGTCVGTGMGFDPAFYYHRPINVYAAHSYGPVLLAGSEVINLLAKQSFEINDSSLQQLTQKR